jgi:hypothetical protein
MKKAEHITLIKSEHEKLEEALQKIPSNQMEISDTPEKWTIKETLVHITYWEKALLADYSLLAKGQPIHELESEEEINALNDATRDHGKTMPLSQAVLEFHQSFDQLITWLDTLSESELDRPFAYGMTLGEFLGEDTWKHYQEHLYLFDERPTK